MLFNTLVFFAFFSLILSAYLFLRHRAQNLLLLAASYVFYAFWDYRFALLLLISTGVDYACGIGLEKTERRGRRICLLVTSLFTNLGILGFFKYYDFFIDSLNTSLMMFGFDPAGHRLELILPVGISFYTFQTLSYTIDVYRGQIRACRNFLDFALYVSFFPQLVAGPIERAGQLLPQIQQSRRLTLKHFESGVWLILLGLFQKAVIADNCAPIADRVFQAPAQATGLQTLTATYAFAFQIYGDFAGYSNIARGLAALMGFSLMQNFHNPYFAINPSDFWRRWHISLSSWLRDYLYIPLGGSRHSRRRTAINLMLTMILGGLWHGAALHFVLWGAFHGILLILYHARTDSAASLVPDRPFSRFLKMVFFFHVTCLGWMIFRIESVFDLPVLMERISRIPTEILHTDLFQGMQWLYLVALIAPLLILDRAKESHGGPLVYEGWKPATRLAVYTALCFAISLLGALHGNAFIYFQF